MRSSASDLDDFLVNLLSTVSYVVFFLYEFQVELKIFKFNLKIVFSVKHFDLVGSCNNVIN